MYETAALEAVALVGADRAVLHEAVPASVDRIRARHPDRAGDAVTVLAAALIVRGAAAIRDVGSTRSAAEQRVRLVEGVAARHTRGIDDLSVVTGPVLPLITRVRWGDFAGRSVLDAVDQAVADVEARAPGGTGSALYMLAVVVGVLCADLARARGVTLDHLLDGMAMGMMTGWAQAADG